MKRLALSWCVVGVAMLATSVPAQADVFGPISLVSEGAIPGGVPEQAEYAHDAAISGNGRYVAFDGSVGGVRGVWRRDLAMGTIEQVAGGDAEMPSISETGQYVSFTTNEGASLAAITDGRPHEAPAQEAVNVYRRDMGASPSDEGAFAVVSAPSGSTEPLRYTSAVGAGTKVGASAAGRSAISADGNEVAFVTTAPSDLVRYPKLEEEEAALGKTPSPHTPALQVAVRYLDSDTTVLVSRCYFHCEDAAGEGAAEPVVGREALGAVYPGKTPEFPAVPESGEWPGASISADGSTVAWMGEDVGEQGPTLAAENLEPLYTEPLWRRIAPGSETPTERVTGGSDPESPACVASGESSVPNSPSPSDPCGGPFVKQTAGVSSAAGIWGHGPDIGDFIPQLSADGVEVAFLSQEGLVSGGYGVGGRGESGQESDLYVADMRPGLTRDQALTPLTEIGPEGVAFSAPIADFAISPDGRQVAFATARTQFPLATPAPVSEPAPEPGLPELFDADLADGTLTRVTHGFLGGASEEPHTTNPLEEDQYGPKPEGIGALSPSFSSNGAELAFSSTADNLVYGDGNTPPVETISAVPDDGSDAFLVERETFASQTASQSIGPAPATAAQPSWRLGVSAVTRADGSVLLYVRTPGAGALSAGAHGAVVIGSVRSSRPARHRSRGTAAGGHAARSVAERTVAATTVRVRSTAGEPVTLVLRLKRPYAALAAQRDGLSASVNVVFSSPGRPTLRGSIEVRFLRKSAPVRRSSKVKAKKQKAGHSSRRGSTRR